ncbi:MAG TPA: kelch repeat-containing protein [Thermoanaerobaculia bacterium]|nr:kelch repeat-containing protein [Thermoanaerobaculia bacterium]
MSVFTRRNLFLTLAFAFLSHAALAKYPSGRTYTRMVYDPVTTHTILFGGATALDSGTRLSYDLADTWIWNGDRWLQLFPATTPPGRSGHAMVYDAARSQIVMFGGKSGKEYLNDTWVFRRGNWSKIETAAPPEGRTLAAAAYDAAAGRMVLFGGSSVSADGKTTTTHADTWEFDGAQWQRLAATGPTVLKPQIEFDAARGQLIMLGASDKGETVMYAFDRAARAWNEVKPEARPACANEASLVYNAANQTILAIEGVCASSGFSGVTWEWNGQNWTKLETKTAGPRQGGAAMAYDAARQQVLVFGGTPVISNPTSTMWKFAEGDWATVTHTANPAPRSLFGFQGDPARGVIWLFGGISDESGSLDDLWRYQGGLFQKIAAEKSPVSCGGANAAFDTDRAKLVVVCTDSSTHEWDGTAWQTFSDLRTKPPVRRFSSMVYDPSLKKTVLFGGYDDLNYLQQTWTWDGTQWTEVKRDRPHRRALASMWYDPVLKKTVIFGGIGRKSEEGRLERFSDMWSFDGTQWTEIRNVATTPGARYGAQAGVNPRTSRVYLFGGLRLETSGVTQSQVYGDDLWEWDGSTWKKLAPATTPPARENGRFEFDPLSGEMVLFGGYAGYFLSDVWFFNGTDFRVRPDLSTNPAPSRRRVASGGN